MVPINYKKSVSTFDVKQCALYKKAIDIYTLSRKLNDNHLPHTCHQETSAYSHNQGKLLEDLAVVSIRLPFTIALAQTTPNYNLKLRSSQRINQSIKRLKMYCNELKVVTYSDSEQLSTMHKELSSFSKMYRNWRLILTQQN